tara:strand:- start:707 stop:898 length:192 start_codon:yes stop_codon:yes gene_type:complete
MKRTYSYIIYLISSLGILIFISACEDDAILSPQGEDECKPGESYCNLTLPNSNNYASLNPEIY